MEKKFTVIQTYLERGQIPPVEQWDPEFCGDSEMRIARDGRWYHQGTPIGRHKLVKLFASVLKREGDDYFLVTPVEKLAIQVDIAPFVIVDAQRMQDDPQQIQLTTNLDEVFCLNKEHAIQTQMIGEQQVVLVNVRRNLPAVINSSTLMQLLQWAEPLGAEQFQLMSDGQVFLLGSA